MPTHTAPRSAHAGDARARAAAVLTRVEEDHAFAAPVLDAALDRAPVLSPEDRAFATDLVYGVLRTAPALDARLDRHTSRAGSLAKLEPYTRTVMRLAAFQILAMDRVPARAAVHDAVARIKRDRSLGLSRFVNAVLRKLADEQSRAPLDDARVVLALESVASSVRDEIAQALGGPGEATSALRAMYARAHGSVLRTNVARTTREALIERLRAEWPDAHVRAGTVTPWSVHVSRAGDVTRSSAWRDGWFTVQEEGAQFVALAADARPGMRVLDACAGRGGKTTAMAATMRGEGTLHAAEKYPDRVARIADEFARLGLDAGALGYVGAATDLTQGLGALAKVVPDGGYDLVVVDAPCSGYGTLARHPEARLRAHDRGALLRTQAAILDRVAPLVRAGGALVYAVCTWSADEGPAQIAAFCARHPRFATGAVGAETAAWVLRPDREGTDGFMVWRLRATG